MIKRIENGDVSQVAGGEIKQVLRLPGGRRVKGTPINTSSNPLAGCQFIVTDGTGKLLVPCAMNADDARDAERRLLGDKANTTQYLALTGKMVDFPN